MPIISLCSPKGGAGKTTTSVLVATVLADQGESVTIIDADPNKAVCGGQIGLACPGPSPSSTRTPTP